MVFEKMNRSFWAARLAVVVLLTGVSAFSADWVADPTWSVNSDGDLTVSFSERGTGATKKSGIQYTLSTSGVTAQFACKNPNGKVSNSRVVSGSGDASSNIFFGDRNGKVTGSLTLYAPEPPAAEELCPNGGKWTVFLQAVTYNNVLLQSPTGNSFTFQVVSSSNIP